MIVKVGYVIGDVGQDFFFWNLGWVHRNSMNAFDV
jgi:hypothetical protein